MKKEITVSTNVKSAHGGTKVQVIIEGEMVSMIELAHNLKEITDEVSKNSQRFAFVQFCETFCASVFHRYERYEKYVSTTRDEWTITRVRKEREDAEKKKKKKPFWDLWSEE